MDPDHVAGQVHIFEGCEASEQDMYDIAEQQGPSDRGAALLHIGALDRPDHALIKGYKGLEGAGRESITFLPRSKRLLISWLQSPSEVILEPKKIMSDTVSTVSPSTSHEVVGTCAM